VPFGGLQAGREGGTTERTVLEVPATTATWRPVPDGGRPIQSSEAKIVSEEERGTFPSETKGMSEKSKGRCFSKLSDEAQAAGQLAALDLGCSAGVERRPDQIDEAGRHRQVADIMRQRVDWNILRRNERSSFCGAE
jgi:hypothetical protein